MVNRKWVPLLLIIGVLVGCSKQSQKKTAEYQAHSYSKRAPAGDPDDMPLTNEETAPLTDLAGIAEENGDDSYEYMLRHIERLGTALDSRTGYVHTSVTERLRNHLRMTLSPSDSDTAGKRPFVATVVGLPGSGKTFYGQTLRELLSLNDNDFEQVVVLENKDIHDIFPVQKMRDSLERGSFFVLHIDEVQNIEKVINKLNEDIEKAKLYFEEHFPDLRFDPLDTRLPDIVMKSWENSGVSNGDGTMKRPPRPSWTKESVERYSGYLEVSANFWQFLGEGNLGSSDEAGNIFERLDQHEQMLKKLEQKEKLTAKLSEIKREMNGTSNKLNTSDLSKEEKESLTQKYYDLKEDWNKVNNTMAENAVDSNSLVENNKKFIKDLSKLSIQYQKLLSEFLSALDDDTLQALGVKPGEVTGYQLKRIVDDGKIDFLKLFNDFVTSIAEDPTKERLLTPSKVRGDRAILYLTANDPEFQKDVFESIGESKSLGNFYKSFLEFDKSKYVRNFAKKTFAKFFGPLAGGIDSKDFNWGAIYDRLRLQGDNMYIRPRDSRMWYKFVASLFKKSMKNDLIKFVDFDMSDEEFHRRLKEDFKINVPLKKSQNEDFRKAFVIHYLLKFDDSSLENMTERMIDPVSLSRTTFDTLASRIDNSIPGVLKKNIIDGSYKNKRVSLSDMLAGTESRPFLLQLDQQGNLQLDYRGHDESKAVSWLAKLDTSKITFTNEVPEASIKKAYNSIHRLRSHFLYMHARLFGETPKELIETSMDAAQVLAYIDKMYEVGENQTMELKAKKLILKISVLNAVLSSEKTKGDRELADELLEYLARDIKSFISNEVKWISEIIKNNFTTEESLTVKERRLIEILYDKISQASSDGSNPTHTDVINDFLREYRVVIQEDLDYANELTKKIEATFTSLEGSNKQLSSLMQDYPMDEFLDELKIKLAVDLDLADPLVTNFVKTIGSYELPEVENTDLSQTIADHKRLNGILVSYSALLDDSNTITDRELRASYRDVLTRIQRKSYEEPRDDSFSLSRFVSRNDFSTSGQHTDLQKGIERMAFRNLFIQELKGSGPKQDLSDADKALLFQLEVEQEKDKKLLETVLSDVKRDFNLVKVRAEEDVDPIVKKIVLNYSNDVSNWTEVLEKVVDNKARSFHSSHGTLIDIFSSVGERRGLKSLNLSEVQDFMRKKLRKGWSKRKPSSSGERAVQEAYVRKLVTRFQLVEQGSSKNCSSMLKGVFAKPMRFTLGAVGVAAAGAAAAGGVYYLYESDIILIDKEE